MVTREDLWGLASGGAPLAEQRGQLRRGLLERGVPQSVIDAVMATACDGYVLWATDEETGSRAGGVEEVRLPTGVSWPENHGLPLTFLFEICFDELIGREGVAGPRSGVLQIFSDELLGVDGSSRHAVRVLYRPLDDGGVASEGAGYQLQASGRIPLRGHAIPTLPMGAELDAALEDVEAIDDGDAVIAAYEDLRPHTGVRTYGLLDAPQTRQGTLVEDIRWWFKNAEAESEFAHFSESERHGEGWRNLMELSDIPGVDLSTAGDRYLVIPEVDLTTGRFDRVIALDQG